MKSVELGFAEDIEFDDISVSCKIIPCIIGGNPKWLDLENIPTVNDVKCRECQESMVFLCQVYAPIEEKPECFHRTLFIFICRNEGCNIPNNARNIVCFRSQLPQSNKFYPSEVNALDGVPFNEIMESTLKSPENFGVSLCNVCGCRGPHRCAKCKLISYCSKEHQKLDWSEHRDECGSRSVKGIRHYLFDIPLSPFFFPKYELTLEEEDCEKVKEVDKEKKSEAMDDEEDDESENEETEKAKLKEFDEFVKANDPNSKLDVEDLEKYATGEDDQDFSYFKKRTLIYPDQVLRYHKGETPLWITSKNKLDIKDVPHCESCNSPRQFEFQIMPQLLNSLNEETLDWGIIAIYTCVNSCNTESSYLREYVYKQDLIQTD